MKLGVATAAPASFYHLPPRALGRLTADETWMVERIRGFGWTRILVTFSKLGQMLGWGRRRTAASARALMAKGVLGLSVKTARQLRIVVPDDVERRVERLAFITHEHAEPPTGERLNAICSRVAGLAGARAACIVRHVATRHRGECTEGVGGIQEAVGRMGHPGGRRTVLRDIAKLVVAGVLVSTRRARTSAAYRIVDRMPECHFIGQADVTSSGQAIERIKEEDPSKGADPVSVDRRPSGESVLDPSPPLSPSSKSSRSDPDQPVSDRSRAPEEQRPNHEGPTTMRPKDQANLFEQPEDRVWETFMAERRGYLSGLFRSDPRRLARLLDPDREPRLSRDRRRSLVSLIARCGDEAAAKRAAVGLWNRKTNREDFTNTTVEHLFKADDGYLELLMGWGDDVIDRRAEKVELETSRRARSAERQATRTRMTPEQARALDEAIAAEERRAAAELDNVVPMRRAK